MGERVIDPYGAVCLLITILTAKLFTPEPRMLAMKVGASAWLVTFLAGIVALAGYWILITLLKRFPGQSLAGINMTVLGPWAGRTVTLVYVFYCLYLGGISSREFASGFRLAIMPRTPLSALTLIYVAVVLFTAGKGMEALARMAAYLVPIMGVLFLFALVGPIRLMDVHSLFPLLGQGAATTLLMPFPESSLYSEIILLGFMAGMMRPGDLPRTGRAAMLGGIVGQTAGWLALCMIFPDPMLTRFSFPMLEMVRMIELSEIVQRLEALFVLLWFFVAGLKLTLLLLSASLLFTEVFDLADYRQLLLPLTAVVYAIAFMPPDEISVVWLDSYTLRTWSWPVSYGLPAVALAAAALRRKRGVHGENAPTASG